MSARPDERAMLECRESGLLTELAASGIFVALVPLDPAARRAPPRAVPIAESDEEDVVRGVDQ
jgi:hypothetical protein